MPSGKVTDYAEDMQMGVIKTPDEKRFIFAKPDWLSPDTAPQPGMDVLFDTAGPSAKSITIAPASEAEKTGDFPVDLATIA